MKHLLKSLMPYPEPECTKCLSGHFSEQAPGHQVEREMYHPSHYASRNEASGGYLIAVRERSTSSCGCHIYA